MRVMFFKNISGQCAIGNVTLNKGKYEIVSARKSLLAYFIISAEDLDELLDNVERICAAVGKCGLKAGAIEINEEMQSILDSRKRDDEKQRMP